MSELWCGIVIAGGFTAGEHKRWGGAREIRARWMTSEGRSARYPRRRMSVMKSAWSRSSSSWRDWGTLADGRVGEEDVQGERIKWGPVDGISEGALTPGAKTDAPDFQGVTDQPMVTKGAKTG
ncbi:hypothetical protein DFH09DRAFT_1072217 [Mycena vulgaris]|nr:hypothetical protein DFH09DRAFT_1072217 [Mycena vulgaris]